MFTMLTTALLCGSPSKGVINKHPDVPAIKNGNIQNISKALDIISGFALIVVAFGNGSAMLGVLGGLQLWPLALFLTTVLYECKQGGPKGDIVFVVKPCCCARPQQP